MLKRLTPLLLLLIILAVPFSAGAAKSYRAERFDVDWNLTEAGVLEVTETVVFRFEGGPFTFVYRDLLRSLDAPVPIEAGDIDQEGSNRN